MSWYILRSATRQEHKVCASLIEEGFNAYLPMLTRWAWRRGAARKERVEQPLFTGYLFVDLPEPARFDLVLAINGAHAFLRRSEGPAEIPAELVGAFIMAQARGEFDKTKPSAHDGPFKPGDPVAVIKGKFTDWPAQVIAMDGETRVRLLVKAFGRNHEKTLSVDSLRAA